MSGDQNARLIYGLVWIVILISSLAARQLPLGQTLKMALSWVGIFALVFVGFSFRYEALQVWSRVKTELSGGDRVGADGSVRLRKQEDGHFYANASLNGHAVSLLVDSGATVTSISVETAKAANVATDGSPFPVMVDTANGVAKAERGTIKAFSIGPIHRDDLPVFISVSFGDTNVVGMNFLSSLKGWRVEGDVMVLNP
jgi:aspartyl protease family protein